MLKQVVNRNGEVVGTVVAVNVAMEDDWAKEWFDGDVPFNFEKRAELFYACALDLDIDDVSVEIVDTSGGVRINDGISIDIEFDTDIVREDYVGPDIVSLDDDIWHIEE